MASVLVIGGGGREHALGWKLAQSPEVEKVYFAPGNGGTSAVGENISIAVDDFDGLFEFAQKKNITLTVVGPEQPLVDGIVERFEAAGLAIFGPSAKAAQLEASKAFTADFMARHDIPQPISVTVNSLGDALAYIEDKEPTSYVIKTSGLAAGKGVVVPETYEESVSALKDIMEKKIFGDSGSQVVFQERLRGQEVSAFALSDGKNIVMLPFFQDHKQVNDGDTGPNTGGMGAYSPLPFMTDELAERIRVEIMQATIDGMQADGNPYKGVLYAGLFVTEAGEPKVIEFNCRFGDPECEPMMLAIENDLYPLLLASAKGALTDTMLGSQPADTAVATVVLASGGYPSSYETGKPIHGLDKISGQSDVVVFHAGTKMDGEELVTSGGRVLAVTAKGKDLADALKRAYLYIGDEAIHFDEMHYRTDIGHRVL